MSTPMQDCDRPAVQAFIEEHWRAPHLCIKGRLYRPHEYEGFVVRDEGAITALITYVHDSDDVLILTQNSRARGAGIGTSQVLKVIGVARERKAKRIWLTTTNANLEALGFYQRMGFRIAGVHRDGIDEARRTQKHEIPEFAPNGLPLRDEIEMELVLEYV
jgi:GNAT superfamily N-acetyltransferase